MEFAQSPSAYPIGPCIVDWLSTNLNASLYLDASLDAFKVSLVTLPFFLFFGFPCVFLLGLDVVLLEGGGGCTTFSLFGGCCTASSLFGRWHPWWI